jgi:hypothetical protein
MKTVIALALLLGAVLCVDYYPQQQHQQYNYPPQQHQQGYYPQPVYGQSVYPKFVNEDSKPDKPLDGEFIEGTLKAGGESYDEGRGIAVTKYYVFITGSFSAGMTIGG